MPRFDPIDRSNIPKLETNVGLALPELHDLDKLASTGKEKKFDPIKDYFEKLADEARKKGASTEHLIKVAEIFDREIDLPDKTAELIRLARKLIEKGEFLKALDTLDIVLQEFPDHPEALYLKALCYHKLGEHEESLVTLQLLDNIRLDSNLATAVVSLRDSVRTQLFGKMLIDFLMMMAKKDYGEVITRLQQIIPLDSTRGTYYVMLASAFMATEQLQEATKTLHSGLTVCPVDERPLLERLKREVERRYLVEAMHPALVQFKAGNYARARLELSRVETELRRAPLYTIFNDYLVKLGGGSGILGRLRRAGDVREIVPRGNHEDVKSFYFFLVNDEITSGQDLITHEKFDEAEDILKRAVGYAPHFPIANMLYGICIYRRVGHQLSGGNPPALGTVVSDLEKASRHAEVGASDQEVPLASTLVKVIGDLIDQLREVQEEVKAVNRAIEEFDNIMNMAKDGISSVSQLDQIYERMSQLKRKIPGIYNQVKSKQGKKALDQLSKAVSRDLQQLESSREEMGPISSAAEEFKQIIESTEGGITSENQLNQVYECMSQLKRKTPGIYNQVKSKQGKETLDQLSEAIDRHLKQMESGREEVESAKREAEPINDAIREFSDIMNSAKGGISSIDQVVEIDRSLSELEQRIPQIRSRTTSTQGREALDKLSEAVASNLKQVRELIDVIPPRRRPSSW